MHDTPASLEPLPGPLRRWWDSGLAWSWRHSPVAVAAGTREPPVGARLAQAGRPETDQVIGSEPVEVSSSGTSTSAVPVATVRATEVGAMVRSRLPRNGFQVALGGRPTVVA